LDALGSCEDYHIFIRPKDWIPMLLALSRMSRVGQKRRFDRLPVTSGLPRQADMLSVRRHVAKVPAAEIKSGGADRPLSTLCNYPAGVHAGFVLLTDVDAQLEQFTVNARRYP
jgi:hypothetical protein